MLAHIFFEQALFDAAIPVLSDVIGRPAGDGDGLTCLAYPIRSASSSVTIRTRMLDAS
jgi:hypothetical protein